MNKDKLILKDGSVIKLEAGASLTALQVICQSAVPFGLFPPVSIQNLEHPPYYFLSAFTANLAVT